MENKNENKIELTPFQYASHWWIKRIKNFVEDVIRVGYSTDEGIAFTQMFDGLKDEHWRILYLKISGLIEDEYKKSGKFVQSTKASWNDHYVGHEKINEMLKSIINIDIPNATLNPEGQISLQLSIFDEAGQPNVFLSNDNGMDKMIRKVELIVEKDYILTGDKSLLSEDTNIKSI
ncbi:MAG: hypothetical protein J6A28_03025 [Clostridia bacterium]|nr:hypothetical protein [Clostridia bacterium]